MDRLQYRDMIRRERLRTARMIKAGEAGSTLAQSSKRRVESSFSKPTYYDSYEINSPPTITRFFPLGFGILGTTLGLIER